MFVLELHGIQTGPLGSQEDIFKFCYTEFPIDTDDFFQIDKFHKTMIFRCHSISK